MEENSELLEQCQRVLKLLTNHAKEEKCDHKVSELLKEVNFDE